MFICIVFLLVRPAITVGQETGVFRSYTVDDGLPQSSIQAITQDRHGFLWVGTADGICRFDGYSFKTFKHNPTDKKSSNSDWHNQFYKDRSGRLWMASYNGISLYNDTTDNFTNVMTYDTKTVVTTENKIFGEDAGFLWCGLSNWGLVRVNKRTLKAEKVNVKGLYDPTEVFSWYRGFVENGKIWIVTRRDSYIYTIKTGALQAIPVKTNWLMPLNDSLAFGFNDKSILLINKRSLVTKQIPVEADGSDHNFRAAIRLSEKEVLFCSNPKGLYYFNLISGTITRRISTTGTGSGNKLINATCAFTDHSGNLWVGTNNDGLLVQPKPYRKFWLYRSPDSKSNQVFSIFADPSSVYVGVANNGIDVFDRDGGYRENIPVNKIAPGLQNQASVTIPVNKYNIMLIINSGITGKANLPAVYNRQNGMLSAFNEQVVNTHQRYWGQGNFRQFTFRYSDSVFLTNAGEYLLAITRSPLGQFSESVFHHFPGHMLSCAYADRAGNLWIGVYKGVFIRRNGTWQQIPLPKPVEVKCVLEDERGNFWLATGVGIFILDRNYKLNKVLTQQNYLLNEHVYAMLKDDDGNIWFSHNKGLSIYRWREREFRHYTDRDGLQAAEFNSAAYFKADNGELFFGGINGTTAFFPKEIRENPHAPKPIITAINVSDKPYPNGSAWTRTELRLPYTEKSISFEFALPEFSDPERNRYSYFMDGIDEHWIDAGKRTFARYASLAPGTYTFRVRGMNAHGVRSEIRSVRILVVPPFWQLSWFKILMIILAIVIIVLILRFIEKQRFSRKMRAFEIQRKLQLERERISRDLHDNVGTQLSLISKNIEGFLDPLDSANAEEKERHLISISQTSKEVIGTLRETIWALNKDAIPFDEFADKFGAYARKQTETYKTLRLHLLPELSGGKTVLAPTEAIHLFRICQEATANALKYANAANISISFSDAGNKYQIQIGDDGGGYTTDQVPTDTYGIANMRYRASEIGCNLEITSVNGKGTLIILQKQ